MCLLYLPSDTQTNSGSSSDDSDLATFQAKEMFFDSPKFQPYQESNVDSLKSPEFINKYAFFIRVVYICIRLEIPIFVSHKSGALVLASHRELKAAIYLRKKKLLEDHILVLKRQHRAHAIDYTDEYLPFYQSFQREIDAIHKILRNIDGIIAKKIASEQDNLLTMLLPYFRAKERFIETYR